MDRRKFLVGLGSASVGGSALIGSGAFSQVESHRAVTIAVAQDPDAYLGLDKCPGSANGSYAWLDENGHLAIRMDEENPTHNGDVDDYLGAGVNSNSTSWFDRVFQVCNQGKQAICLWIEDDDAWPMYDGERRVEFYYEGNDDNSIVGEDNRLTLNVGDCACIGIKTRTYGLSDGDELLGELDNQIQINATVECFEDPECADEEALYLTNSGASGGTELLTVDELDASAGEARLTSHQTVSDGGTFDQVDSLAATPDGDWLYFYDKHSGHLGRLDTSDLAGNSIQDLGEVENAVSGDPAPQEVVLGAFSPAGTLYAVGQGDDKLWEIDHTATPPQATEIGDTGIDVQGSDLVFDPDTLYLHSNGEDPDLHQVDVNDGSTTALCDVGENLTGLAIREGGVGEILGSVAGNSTSLDGEIVAFDPNDCGVTQSYEMMLNGESYDYQWGDMATGPRCTFGEGF